MNQSGKMKIILEAAVARLNKRRYRKPVGTWVAGTSYRTSHETIAFPKCELPASRVPIGGLFRNFSLTLRVTKYFLALARKINDLLRFS